VDGGVRSLLETSVADMSSRHLLQTYGSETTFAPGVPMSYWQNFVVRARVGGRATRRRCAQRPTAHGPRRPTMAAAHAADVAARRVPACLTDPCARAPALFNRRVFLLHAQGPNVANAPYTLSFSNGQVYNDGTGEQFASACLRQSVGATHTAFHSRRVRAALAHAADCTHHMR
jgi:hypothetical protein